MPTRSPEIITRASEVDEDLVPEPWDDRDAAEDQEIVTRRERYRLDGVTDEGGAGIVPAYNLNVADTEAIPQKTQDGWTRGSAGRVLGPDGKYVSRGSDVPRLSYDGEDPGLLVEAAGRTNHVEYSSDLTQWGTRADAQIGSAETSVFKGETAHQAQVTSNPSFPGESELTQNAGATTTSIQTVWALVEEGTAAECKLGGQDATQGGAAEDTSAVYDFSSDSFSVDQQSNGTVQSTDSRIIGTGPNGNSLRLLIVRIIFDTGGNDRDIKFAGGQSGGVYTTFHHAQIEEAPNASSPIVTQGSPVTRSADDYAIFEGGQPEWWNPNEGTIIFEFEAQKFVQGSFNTNVVPTSSSGRMLELEGSEPFNAAAQDTNANFARVADAVNVFQKTRLGISLTRDKIKLSANGSYDEVSSNGSLLTTTDLNIGFISAVVDRALYFPRALSESTLNRITS